MSYFLSLTLWKLIIFFIPAYLWLGKHWVSDIKETHQWWCDSPGMKIWVCMNIALKEVTSRSGQHECLPQRKKSDHLGIKDMQFVSKHTSSLCSSCKALLGGYLGWILCSNGFLWYSICKGCALPWVQVLCSKEKRTSQFNLFLQPTWVHSDLACESTVMMQPLSI